MRDAEYARTPKINDSKIMQGEQEKYNELAFYTLDHKDPAFIHQNIVDAFCAQNADCNTKPIAITFALLGLYLFLEKGFTGRQVQLAHMELAKKKIAWPKLVFPEDRGRVTVLDVLSIPAGPDRDNMIRKWCACVWEAWKNNKPQIISYLKEGGI